ncbi:MAG: HxsD-like protein [Polyangiales bacterium]
MIELRFHRELYDGKSIDEALKIFGAHAGFEQAEEPTHWIVRVTGADPAREKRIAGELANYALGLTIQRAGTSPAAQS